MSDLRVANARYWSRKEHTALDKSASALRQQRLIQIKLELADARGFRSHLCLTLRQIYFLLHLNSIRSLTI